MRILFACLIILSYVTPVSADNFWLDAWQQKKNRYNYEPSLPSTPNYLLFKRSQQSPSPYQRMKGINNFFGTNMTPNDYILFKRALE